MNPYNNKHHRLAIQDYIKRHTRTTKGTTTIELPGVYTADYLQILAEEFAKTTLKEVGTVEEAKNYYNLCTPIRYISYRSYEDLLIMHIESKDPLLNQELDMLQSRLQAQAGDKKIFIIATLADPDDFGRPLEMGSL
jgi:hypothetical protein